MTQYEVVRGAVKVPFPKGGSKLTGGKPVFIMQGEIIPDDMLSTEEAKSLLADGRIVKLRPSSQARPAAAVTAKRGKWAVDPETLAGKELEELAMLVLGIDEDFDVTKLKTKALAIKQLTKDWDPTFADAVAKSYDKNSPGVQSAQGVQSSDSTQPASEKAAQALQRARAKAEGQQAAGEDNAETE